MNPCEDFPSVVLFDGKTYRINPTWMNVLGAIEVLEDTNISDELQLSTALSILVEPGAPLSSRLLKAVFDTINSSKMEKSEKQSMDFFQDWDYIYAAFWQTYGIDLYQYPDMHWMKFSALLRGIPEGTRFSEIIAIREMDIPEPNKHNGKQRAKIMEMKSKYALKKSDTTLQEGLIGIFNAMVSKARGGE